MLQYDNSAFYFFALSFLSIYLIPAWYSILKTIWNAYVIDDASIGAVSRTSVEEKKVKELKKEARGLSKVFQNSSYVAFVVITIVLTIVFLVLLVSVSSDSEVNSFDPFQILEIDSGADAKQIKRAYRNLSLKYHPDKNPGDRASEAKFMMVSKAYEALTDEVARENWEKYGNPDGKQSLEVSIGLPSFLLETTNRNAVLLTYLIFMVGVIPYCVWSYYSDSSQFGEKNVMYDTYAWYHHTLGEHTLIKNIPEVLAGSAEFRVRNQAKSNEDKKAIGQLATQVRGQMVKPKFNHPVCVKGNVLLHTHLLRKTSLLNEQHAEDLRYMLRSSSQSLVDAMISVCQHQNAFQTAQYAIEFGQYMIQALWVRDSHLLQIPHFTAEEVKHATTANKNKITTIAQYRDLPEDQRKGQVHFTDDQKKDVSEFLDRMYPDLEVEVKVFVDDDDDDQVYEGDLLTIQVKITRKQLQQGEKVGLIHAPHFPFPIKDAFWVILGQIKEGKIMSIEKVVNPNRVVIHRIKFMAPPKGHYEFDLLVKSNGYVGVDHKERLSMTTLDNSTLPAYKIHPDDENLDDEPTLFEEMLNQHIEQDSDDEDEEDSDDDDDDDQGAQQESSAPPQTQSAASKKRQALLKARRQVDDDDDDDDDAEEVYADK